MIHSNLINLFLPKSESYLTKQTQPFYFDYSNVNMKKAADKTRFQNYRTYTVCLQDTEQNYEYTKL